MIRVVHPGSRILMLTFSHPGSRGQKGTQSRIPDPDPQHWAQHLLLMINKTSLGPSVSNPRHFCTDPDPHLWLTDPDPQHCLRLKLGTISYYSQRVYKYFGSGSESGSVRLWLNIYGSTDQRILIRFKISWWLRLYWMWIREAQKH